MKFSNQELANLGFTLSRNEDRNPYDYDPITTVVGGMDNVDRAIEEMSVIEEMEFLNHGE